MPKAKVISLVNMKGGVGKTRAPSIWPRILRATTRKSAARDLDPQTNTSLSLMAEDTWRNGPKSAGHG